MLVTVKGTVLEKFSKESKAPEGRTIQNLYLRLFQPGQRMNLDIKVEADTWSTYDSGEVVELDDIIISTFNNVLYARQQTNGRS